MTLLHVIFYFSNYVCTLLLQPIVVKCDHVLKKCKHFHCCRSLNNNFFSSFKNLVVVFTVTLPPAVAIHSLVPTHFTNITLSQQLSTITPISFWPQLHVGGSNRVNLERELCVLNYAHWCWTLEFGRKCEENCQLIYYKKGHRKLIEAIDSGKYASKWPNPRGRKKKFFCSSKHYHELLSRVWPVNTTGIKIRLGSQATGKAFINIFSLKKGLRTFLLLGIEWSDFKNVANCFN